MNKTLLLVSSAAIFVIVQAAPVAFAENTFGTYTGTTSETAKTKIDACERAAGDAHQAAANAGFNQKNPTVSISQCSCEEATTYPENLTPWKCLVNWATSVGH